MNQDSRSAEIGTDEFFQKTLDSLLSHIAILAEDGSILAVNAPWRRFAVSNGLEEDYRGPGANYLRACDAATGDCSEEADGVGRGIRDVVAGLRPDYYLEYPRHSPTPRRWYSVRITRFTVADRVRVVVAHDDITARKLAEIDAREANRLLAIQATTDGLTGVANRRSFDQALAREWARLGRDGGPLTLALLDVDCFKAYNDHNGHQAGDECLRAVARAIASRVRGPVDLVARFGGEEFAVILPAAGPDRAAEVLRGALDAIRALAIPHPHSKVGRRVVTASLGHATAHPAVDLSPADLVQEADRALYEAKALGRDRMIAADALEPALAR